MSRIHINSEHLLFGLAFGLALLMRFLMLGLRPISDPEAALALQALGLASGQHPALTGFPGYLQLTGLTFFLLGSSTFLARLWPALAGSLLVLAPAGFRSRLGGKPALILAFLIALDPVLISLSREAGSAMLAVAFTTLAAGYVLQRKPVRAGLFAGLALLGGPQFWAGIVIFAISAGLYALVRKSRFFGSADSDPAAGEPDRSAPAREFWQTAGIAFMAVVLLAGTLLFMVPEGIAALGVSLSTWVRSWAAPGGLPAGWMAIALLGDELFVLFLAVWGIARGLLQRSRSAVGLAIWLGVALIFAFLPAGRQPDSLGWVEIPLLTLAALGLSGLGKAEAEDRLATRIFTAAALVGIGFAWLKFTAILIAWQESPGEIPIYGLELGGGLILLLAAAVLVGWGWSPQVAWRGLVQGMLVTLAVFQLSAAAASADWRLQAPANPVASYPIPRQERFLGETVGDLSFWKTGRRDAIDLIVLGSPSPAMAWFFRNFPNAQSARELARGQQPSLVITAPKDQPQLAASYTGQDFVWDETPAWDSMGAFAWLNWAVFRTAPVQKETVRLWARTDDFLGARLNSSSGNP